jgi:hypothetical protein
VAAVLRLPRFRRRTVVGGAALLAAVALRLTVLSNVTIAAPYPPPHAEPGRHDVTVVETRRVVPDGVPAEAHVQQANNNLDVVRHAGRVFLAFRTAPSHFASDQAVVDVVSSEDERAWRLEASYAMGTDLREPRLLSLGDTLFLYVSRLGKNPFAFEPKGAMVARRDASGAWSPGLEPMGEPGTIVWRARVARGVPTMIAYTGGEHLYAFDGVPMHVEMLTTTDGLGWSPLAGRTAPSGDVYVGGGTEADFTYGDDGSLFAVVRDEAGDANGAGSLLCRAPAAEPTRWSCKADARKFDSPLLFWHDGEAYLVARRQVSADGLYDHGPTWLGGQRARIGLDQAHYIWTGKRCSLWRWVQGEERIAFVLDLPSRGDTCFASALPGAEADEVILYDYSSDIDGPDLVWNAGQRGPTNIYRHVLRFAPRQPTAAR